ncbi:single-stranded-DNA-specific exonuclease RecJ [candidate division WWE3 bacterium]|nr:single-stranded-DNA-specific exonuclease RecJ [candidate division WWE3 bacterium]
MSVASKKWNVRSRLDGKIIDVLLRNRGIVSEDEKKAFLSPVPVSSLANHLDTDFVENVKEACEMVLDAMSKQIPVIIYGDYDVDGVCAASILYKALKKELNYDKTFVFIPNRFEHSYGLSRKGVGDVVKLVGGKRGLIITVDAGITDIDAAKYAKDAGFKLIITDHHQKPKRLPNADLIVWTDMIVASAISYFMSRQLGVTSVYNISLAALATVTDLQPLLGVNRMIVKEGLRLMNDTPPPGIKKLLAVSGKARNEITTYDLGWIVGPRMNAAGRILDAYDSFKLLTEEDEDLLEIIAKRLDGVNKERQDKTLQMYDLIDISDDEIPKIIVSADESYHEGIIGLVASKLVQKYYRPAVVVSLSGEYGKGSVRSVPGVDIISLLRNYEEMFESLGGHPMAAGFTIRADRCEKLKEALLQHARENIPDSLLAPVLDIDVEISLNSIDEALLGQIGKLKPFGVGNKEPLFLSRNVGLAGIDIVGKEGSHLTLRLFDGRSYHKAIFFNGADRADSLSAGDRIDIVYSLKRNEYNGKTYVDLILEDFRHHSTSDSEVTS